MTKLPYKDESFDKVFCLWSSFNHLLSTQEQIKALNEIFRVLRTGGFAFLEMVNAERIWGEIFNGVQATDYMHTRETMRDCLQFSNNFFHHYCEPFGSKLNSWLFKTLFCRLSLSSKAFGNE